MPKIDAKNYETTGLGDIYYGLISFIGSYVSQNFDPMEALDLEENQKSTYALAVEIMKNALKELLEYLKSNSNVFIPSLNREVEINHLNVEEQVALEERCKEYMVEKLNNELKNLKGENQNIKR